MSLNFEERLQIRGDIGYEQNIQALIRLCLLAISEVDPAIFNQRVRLLVSVLPKWVKDSEDFKKKIDECTTEYEKYKYRYHCGVPMGTPENPVMSNTPDSYSYDPNAPSKPISPVLVKETETDYIKMFDVCVNALESLGLTWKKSEEGSST